MSEPEPTSVWTPPALEDLALDFPKLEIQSLLALGGMSAVYLVRQESLDRLAVLKVLPPDTGDDEEASLRFQTEARALASVRDRGVVEVYDFGRTPGGLLYLLLEYEGGGDLRQWIKNRQHPVTPEEALGIGASIAGGVAAAHRRGIIHGDIKPDNIFLDEEGHLKVGDFGLAGSEGSGTATHYTPGYTAPEILAGNRRNTTQADVYAIGATLYELLLTTTPPEETGTLALKLAKLPQPVAEVIGWALQPDPAHRPATALEYRTALDQAAARLRESAAPSSISPHTFPGANLTKNPQAEKSPNHRPLLITAGLAAVLAIGYSVLKPDAPPTPAPAPVQADVPVPGQNPPPLLTESSTPAPLPEPEKTPPEIAQIPTPPAPDPAPTPPPLPEPAAPPDKPEPSADTAWLEEGTTNPDGSPSSATSSLPKGPATDADLAAWNPDWKILTNRGETGGAARFSNDLEDGLPVLVLVPISPSLPTTLSHFANLPADRLMQISIRVAAHKDKNADWVLKAFANDQPLSTPQTISSPSGKPRFSTLSWDLSAWKGQRVNLRLEVHNGGVNNWWFEHSYWNWIRIEPLSPLLANATYQPANASKGPVDPGFVDLFSASQAGSWKSSDYGGLSFNQGIATTFTRPGAKNRGWIWFTKRMFRDFVLQAEFKMDTPEADSGIWLRGVDPDMDPMIPQLDKSQELQIRGHTLGSTSTGSIAGGKAPSSLPIKPGDWNKYEIAVTGTRHLVKLNGVLINEWNSPGTAPGYLAIQHLRTNGEVHFRNVWIREITPGVAVLSNPARPPGPSTRPLGVPPEATPFNGKWYCYYDEKLLWRVAKKKCEDLKGQLVSIKDEATHQFLATLSKERIFWAGASDEKKEGEWLWLDGSPLTFTKWRDNQPDNSSGREDFLTVHPTGWNDDSNEGHSRNIRGFICQWD